jgi:hypothetical protein
VFLSKKRDLKAAAAFFAGAITSNGEPAEITTDRAHALVRVIAELLPAALHDTTQYANNRVEADHGRLKARLRPMRGLKQDRTASVIIEGHAFIQNLQRGHHELGDDALPGMAIAAAFDELALVVWRGESHRSSPAKRSTIHQCNRPVLPGQDPSKPKDGQRADSPWQRRDPMPAAKPEGSRAV